MKNAKAYKSFDYVTIDLPIATYCITCTFTCSASEFLGYALGATATYNLFEVSRLSEYETCWVEASPTLSYRSTLHANDVDTITRLRGPANSYHTSIVGNLSVPI